ncbi:PAS domain S-box protein [Candidatus Poribacteria bacterium]|nr:PAS domain S-box protein [Candidatus Poribacteria bacterium]
MANTQIMIVESNPLVAEDIKQRLQTLGYTVCAVVSTGAEAIKKVHEMRPNMVLVNTELEGQLKGIEVAPDISNRFNLPVVYLIDSINADLLERVKMGREFGYVFKPYETNQLHLIIESQLYRYEENQKDMDEEQQRSTILNNIGDAVIATDEGGFVTFMNPVAETLTGWPLEAACGEYITHIFNVSVGESNRSIRTSLMNVLHRGITLHWGLSVARDNAYLNAKSGLKIAIDYNAAPLKNKKRNIVGMAVTFRDMRKYKEIENQLEQTVTDLQNQNQLMETVFSSISDGIIVIDSTGSPLLANPSAEQIFGMPPQQITPSEWSETYGIFFPDQETYIPANQMPVIQALQGKVLEEGEFFIRNKEQPDGVYAKGRAVPLFDSNREIRGSVAIIRDITKDKKAAAQLEQTITELQNQTQLMDTIFNSISDGVVVTDQKGNFLLVNPSAEKIVGMGATETIPDEWAEKYGTFYPDQVTPFPSDQLPLVHAMQGRGTNAIDLFIRNQENPDGSFINVHGRPLRDQKNEVRGGVIVFRDVTKIKHTEARLEQTIEELEKQAQLMGTIFDNMSDGVVVADDKGQYIMANPAAEKMIGQKFEELNLPQASEQYGLFDPTTGALFPVDQLPLALAIKGKATNNVEMRVNSEQPSQEVYVSVNGRPLLDKKGILRGGVVVARDITQLKKTEVQLEKASTELQNQAQLMETVFNSISDGVVVTDEKGNFLLVNPEAEQIIGMGATETPPDKWSEKYGIFHLDKTTPFPADQPLMRAISGESIDGLDLFIRNSERPAGVYINVSGRALQSSTGSVTGSVIAFRDITKLKETEIQLEQTVSELQNQTQLMETVFNQMSDGVVLADKEGQYIMSNRTAEQMTGRSLQQPVGIRDAVELYGFFLPDEKTPFPADQLPIARTLRGEPANNIGMFVYNPSVMREGIHLSVSARPLYDSQGTVTGGVSVSRDVTELRHAETNLKYMIEQLEEQGALLESIFNSISDGVVVADANGNFTIFNPSAEKIVGIGATPTDPDEWSDTYGLFFPDRVTPFPADELPLVRAIKGEISDEVEMFVRNPNVPEGVFISVSGRPLQDEAGSGKGGVIVFRDVTQRMIAEEALAQAFAQGRLEIVDTILHNIGNAINSVTSGAEMLNRELSDNPLIRRLAALASAIKAREDDWIDYIKNDPQGQQVLPFICAIANDFNNQNNRWLQRIERIKQRATHIADIVSTQRSFGNPSIVRKDVNIYKLIDDALKLQQESINKRDIQIDIDCENAPQEIRIQESQFHQMLVNLIKNSIEAIDELIQSGSLNETPRIRIRTYINEDFYCLEVIDNGIGIKEENNKMIFAAGYTTKKFGSGLGLHSVANFVIASGGQIQSLSEGIGKGTTMRVMLRLSSILP